MTGEHGVGLEVGIGDLLNTAPCGFLTFAEDGTIQLANDTLLQLLGLPREAVVGGHVERILTVGSRIFYQTHWFPLLRLHGAAEEIFLMLRGAGGEAVGAIANAVRRERAGQTVFDCVLVRVRERQKFEDELLRARRAAEEALARLQTHQAELEEANLKLEEQAAELEEQQATLEEQAVSLETTTEELRATNRDLEERTREAELHRAVADEANQAKSAFLAVMSHELRTPLNAIAGYVEILEMGIHGPVNEAQRETLARVDRSQRHLLGLVNDVLNLARIEAGHVEYDLAEVDVWMSVAEVAPMVEPQLERKEITFERDVAHGLMVLADPDKLQQILLNLLGNAAKFTPAGGRVRVDAAVDERASRLLLRVADTGIGIPAEQRESVFHPFVQVDVSRTRTTEGTGLGLAISRDLARGMGGDLTVDSTVGEGSTFTLALPLVPG
jgi:signal transduction histidine kinase